MWTLAFVACTPSDPASPATGGQDPSTGPSDPLAAAMGGCTAIGDEVDRDLGALDTEVLEYDANGDAVHLTADYLDDEQFYDWEIVNTLGAPHQVVESVTTYTRADGWTHRYTWDHGHVVRKETDYASDGTVDEVQSWTLDGDHVVHADWDYDGDGVVDDTLDSVWTETVDGWSIASEGQDPNGPYHVDETRDVALNPLTYDYDDATGLTYSWSIEGYSSLGIDHVPRRTFEPYPPTWSRPCETDDDCDPGLICATTTCDYVVDFDHTCEIPCEADGGCSARYYDCLGCLDETDRPICIVFGCS